MSVTLHIESDQCVGCSICADVCPHAALAMEPTDLAPRQIPGRCTACSLCVQQCPTEAIALLSSQR